MRALLLLLMACGGSDPSGDWSVDSSSFITDDCQATSDLLPTGSLTISTLSDRLYIDFNDGGPETDCEAKGGAFTCEALEVWSDTLRNSTIRVSLSTTGVIDKGSLVGTRTGSTHCEGADCGFLEDQGAITFPCSISLDFSATKAP